MKCPKCNSELEEKAVLDRIRLRCLNKPKCYYLQYKNPSGSVGAEDVIRDDILDAIAKTGNYEGQGALLANVGMHGIGSWCQAHELRMELFYRKERRKDVQYVSISRNF